MGVKIQQQLFIRFIIYVIFTLIFTCFYHVIGIEEEDSASQIYSQFNIFPTEPVTNIMSNMISNTVFNVNVKTCTKTDDCEPGYICQDKKDINRVLYVNGVKLHTMEGKKYCIPSNLDIKQASCSNSIGKMVWSGKGGVSSSDCKSLYPNLFDATSSTINMNPCGSLHDNSFFDDNNELMNSQSFYVIYPNGEKILQKPYTIAWNPYKKPADDEVNIKEKFSPYSTVCDWYNKLQTTTEDGINTFAKYYLENNTSKDAELYTQNKPYCKVSDILSYECHSYNQDECKEHSNVCKINKGICQPKYGGLYKTAQECKNIGGVPWQMDINTFYCRPPVYNDTKTDVLRVLPKIIDENNNTVDKIPLFNCRCLNNEESSKNLIDNNQYCNQIDSQTMCDQQNICEWNAPTSTCTRKLIADTITMPSISLPTSLYTCNSSNCLMNDRQLQAYKEKGMIAKSTLTNNNPCNMMNSKYDCENAPLESDLTCTWQNEKCIQATTPNNSHIDTTVNRQYDCEKKGYTWTAQNTCIKDGYYCNCNALSTMVRSNINGKCYNASCGYKQSSDGNNLDQIQYETFSTSLGERVEDDIYHGACGCGRGNDAGTAIYCNSNIMNREDMCLKFDKNVCNPPSTNGMCEWDSNDTSQFTNGTCKNICQTKTSKNACENTGDILENTCKWNPNDDNTGGTCTLKDCKGNLGYSTGEYCSDYCLPNTCNDARCQYNAGGIQCTKNNMQCVRKEGNKETQLSPDNISCTPTSCPVVMANTFCQSSGLGTGQPVHRSFMNLEPHNPYYTNTPPKYNSETEIDTSIHKHACAAGFKPVKFKYQYNCVSPACSKNSLNPASDTSCAQSCDILNPSNAWSTRLGAEFTYKNKDATTSISTPGEGGNSSGAYVGAGLGNLGGNKKGYPVNDLGLGFTNYNLERPGHSFWKPVNGWRYRFWETVSGTTNNQSASPSSTPSASPSSTPSAATVTPRQTQPNEIENVQLLTLERNFPHYRVFWNYLQDNNIGNEFSNNINTIKTAYNNMYKNSIWSGNKTLSTYNNIFHKDGSHFIDATDGQTCSDIVSKDNQSIGTCSLLSGAYQPMIDTTTKSVFGLDYFRPWQFGFPIVYTEGTRTMIMAPKGKSDGAQTGATAGMATGVVIGGFFGGGGAIAGAALGGAIGGIIGESIDPSELPMYTGIDQLGREMLKQQASSWAGGGIDGVQNSPGPASHLPNDLPDFKIVIPYKNTNNDNISKIYDESRLDYLKESEPRNFFINKIGMNRDGRFLGGWNRSNRDMPTSNILLKWSGGPHAGRVQTTGHNFSNYPQAPAPSFICEKGGGNGYKLCKENNYNAAQLIYPTDSIDHNLYTQELEKLEEINNKINDPSKRDAALKEKKAFELSQHNLPSGIKRARYDEYKNNQGVLFKNKNIIPSFWRSPDGMFNSYYYTPYRLSNVQIGTKQPIRYFHPRLGNTESAADDGKSGCNTTLITYRGGDDKVDDTLNTVCKEPGYSQVS